MPDSRAVPLSYFDAFVEAIVALNFTHLITHQVDTEELPLYFVGESFNYYRITSLVFVHKTKGISLVLRYNEGVWADTGNYHAYWRIEIIRVELPANTPWKRLKKLQRASHDIQLEHLYYTGCAGLHGSPTARALEHFLAEQHNRMDSERSRLEPGELVDDLRPLLLLCEQHAVEELKDLTVAHLAPSHSFPGCANRFFAEFPLAKLQKRVTEPLRIPKTSQAG
jgi:hypothetical protein